MDDYGSFLGRRSPRLVLGVGPPPYLCITRPSPLCSPSAVFYGISCLYGLFLACYMWWERAAYSRHGINDGGMRGTKHTGVSVGKLKSQTRGQQSYEI